MVREVFFTADDFGLDHETNQAIVTAHIRGRLDGAALMVGQPGTEEAVALAQQHPSLKIGWHLHLCDSLPLTTSRWPWGKSPAAAGWSIGLLPSAWCLMKKEVEAQWSQYQQTGLPCAFFNTHHHLHQHPYVWKQVMRVLGPDFPGWIRLSRPCYFDSTPARRLLGSLSDFTRRRRRQDTNAPFSDTIWGLDCIFSMRDDEVRQVISRLPDGFHEFMFHPRRQENDSDFTALLKLK